MQVTKTKKLVLCALFTALIAVGAFIRVPIPVVPFTLQFFFTTLAGLLLGGRLGAAAVLVYVVLGLCGVPVFTEGGGLGYVLKPSFGYLIGFILGTYVTGLIAGRAENPGYKLLLAANFCGLLIVYAFGMAYCWLISEFYLGTPLGLWPLFLYCFVLAVPGDALLCLLAAAIGKRLIPLVRANGWR